MRKVVILSFLTSLLLGACGEDDYVYPNVLTDMIDLKTSHVPVLTDWHQTPRTARLPCTLH